MEAAATGRPVAAYDIRGVREVIDPGLGLLAPRGDVGALAAIIDRLLDDPDRCVELGKRCRTHVTEQFAEDGVIDRLRAVYAEFAPEPDRFAVEEAR
jgi:glycosyltransferase involved in cell wall biosynthesis